MKGLVWLNNEIERNGGKYEFYYLNKLQIEPKLLFFFLNYKKKPCFLDFINDSHVFY